MKILLIKDYPKLGKRGQVVETSDGLARNFLIPKGFASEASSQTLNKINKEQKDAEDKKNRDKQKAENLKNEIEKKIFTIKVKVGENGHLYGGIREKDILEVMNQKLGTNFSSGKIVSLPQIKYLGEHTVEIKLQDGLKAKVNIKLESI